MIIWLSLVIVAQLMNALVVLADKYFLHSKSVAEPVVYAFYVSLLSGFVIVLVPFGLLSWPSETVIVLSLAMALSYILSIFFLYSALKESNASDVVPVTGSVSALSAFVLSFFFLNNILPVGFNISLFLLIIGTLMISRFRFTGKSILYVLLAGVLFGTSAFLVKLVFMNTSFIDGFFWSRMANVIGAIFLLLWPGNFKLITHHVKHGPTRTKWLVVGNKALAGISFALTLFAIKLGNVALVNALCGLQFVFLLAFAYMCAKRFPAIFKGEIYHHRFYQKLVGIGFIVLGFFALFV